MGFVDSISTCFCNYAKFSGKASRSEFWFFFLFVAITTIVFTTALMLIAVSESSAGMIIMGVISLVGLLVYLGSIVPWLAVTVRRLHDTGRSGWAILLSFIPFVGPIVLTILLCQRSVDETITYKDEHLAKENAPEQNVDEKEKTSIQNNVSEPTIDSQTSDDYKPGNLAFWGFILMMIGSVICAGWMLIDLGFDNSVFDSAIVKRQMSNHDSAKKMMEYTLVVTEFIEYIPYWFGSILNSGGWIMIFLYLVKGLKFQNQPLYKLFYAIIVFEGLSFLEDVISFYSYYEYESFLYYVEYVLMLIAGILMVTKCGGYRHTKYAGVTLVIMPVAFIILEIFVGSFAEDFDGTYIDYLELWAIVVGGCVLDYGFGKYIKQAYEEGEIDSD